MKLSKVAAVVAGSVAVLGVASPAFAGEALSPMSLNGGAMDALAATAPLSENLPLHLENALEEQGSAVNTVVKGAEGLNQVRNNAPNTVLETVTAAGHTAPQLAPMLGGLNVNAH